MNNMNVLPKQAGYIKIYLPEDGYKIVWYEDGDYKEMGIESSAKWEPPFDFTWKGWDYLNPEVVVEWNKASSSDWFGWVECIITEKIIIRADPVFGYWHIEINGKMVAGCDMEKSLKSAQAAAITWSNENLAVIPKVRM